MAYCSNCGNRLSDGAKFCPKCGAQVSHVMTNSGKKALRKNVIPLIIILVIAIAIGFRIVQYIKNEEIKNEETHLKEERQKLEAEQYRIKEQKRAEQLSTPIGVFNDIIKDKHHWRSSELMYKYWASDCAHFFRYEIGLFFYPSSETTGRVSIYHYQDENRQIKFINDKESRYEIVGNTIYVADDFTLTFPDNTYSYKFELTIERKSESSAELKDQSGIRYSCSEYDKKFDDKYK